MIFDGLTTVIIYKYCSILVKILNHIFIKFFIFKKQKVTAFEVQSPENVDKPYFASL